MLKMVLLALALAMPVLAQSPDSAQAVPVVPPPTRPALDSAIIYLSTTYKTTLTVISKYKNLELFLNDRSIGYGSKTVSGVPYGKCIIKGKLEGKVLYEEDEDFDEGDATTIEVEVKNPYHNGLAYGIPFAIAACAVIPVIATATTENTRLALGVLFCVGLGGGIVGIRKQVKHIRWVRANRALVDKLEVVE
jgi:hypothetical protein